MVRFGLALGMVAAAGAARADVICATFNGVGPGSNGHYSFNGGADWSNTGAAGHFNWTRTGGDYAGAQGNFMSFCTELTEHISNGGNYCYTVAALEFAPSSGGGMGSAKADLIRELFGRYYTPAFGAPLTGTQATAMQLAIWEIVYEDDSFALGLGTGLVRLTNDNIAAMTVADAYLASLDGTGPLNNTIVVMSGAGIQDQIIPAPGSLALLGLGGLVATRRRR